MQHYRSLYGNDMACDFAALERQAINEKRILLV